MIEPKELSSRQKEFLCKLAQGKLYKQIALEYNISDRTIRNTIVNIKKKYNAQNTAQCVVIAISREELGVDQGGECFIPEN